MKTTTLKIIKATTVFSLVAIAIVPRTANAQTIGNSDFSSPTLGAAFQIGTPPTNAIQRWTFVGRSGVARDDGGANSTFEVADVGYPGQYAYIQRALGQDGSLSQAVNFSSSGLFQLTFLEAGRAQSPAGSAGNLNYTIAITLIGGSNTILSITNASASNQPFTARSNTFLVSMPGDYVLTFASLSGYGIYNDNSTLFDDVSLVRLPDDDLLANIHCSAVDICWAGRTNQLYQVQYRTNISDTNWFDFSSPVLGTGTNCVTDGINGTQQRFYRVIRLP